MSDDKQIMIAKKSDSNQIISAETSADEPTLAADTHVSKSVLPVPSFGPLVETCARYGIKRGMAFLLAREKRIQVFWLNRKTFVVIASIEALAERGDE